MSHEPRTLVETSSCGCNQSCPYSNSSDYRRSSLALRKSFAFATGRSVMRYLRGRRLTEARRSLTNGAPDILSVALEAGYGSHTARIRLS